MGDLEHVGTILPRVFEAVFDERRTAAQAIAMPDSSTTCLPWPPNLRSRLLSAVEAVQACDHAAAVMTLLDLDRELATIDRASEGLEGG